MTAKEYVSQLRGINSRIKMAELELSRMRYDKDQLGAMRYDTIRVSGGIQGDLGDFIIRMQEDIIKQYDKIRALRNLKADIERTVSSIADGRHATLLLLRYEYDCKWDYIATVLSNDRVQVSEDLVRGRMHGRALEDLAERLQVVTK